MKPPADCSASSCQVDLRLRLRPLLPLLCLAAHVACSSDSPQATADDAEPATNTTEHSPAASAPLNDTNWLLVEFQSMSDEVGTIRPADPAEFTMSLAADGTVSMGLGCNRANGTWSAEPGPDGQSGDFTFGPLAMTRALCPPPNLDERIGRDAEFVRSFLLRDGRLHLSLMADGGIYSWAPDTSLRARSESNPKLEEALREVHPDYRAEVVADGPPGRYAWAAVDLDGDGVDEIFAYLLGPFFCGTGGCTLQLFRNDGDALTLVTSFPTSRLPIAVAEQTTNGWRDLFRPESGGGGEPSSVRHTFDGTRYVEGERSAGPLSMDRGLLVLTGEVSFDSGFALSPRKD